jgi:alkaline phosphatase D
MRRRDFLKSAGCFVVTASLGGVTGCGEDDEPRSKTDAGTPDGGVAAKGSYRFPQGVASGDPRPDSVMLWTRVEAQSAKAGGPSISVKLEVATDQAFKHLVVHKQLSANIKADHTLRVLVDGLQPDTIYYYRFTAGADPSHVGRTWTAPKPDADISVRFAWASCQDYSAGFYGAYRRMINDDQAAGDAERLRFVLFVGDFIYETRGDDPKSGLDHELKPIELKDKDGNSRLVPEFPSGGGALPGGDRQFAQTIDDYRLLYKTYLSDPDLQEARARWPFINVWDDHEFSNDCWQTQANYTSDKGFDEPSEQRRVAANQAWFEYQPAILSEAKELDGVKPEAKDFVFAAVEDSAYDDPFGDNPDNIKALATITIYRRLRFGKHVDLVLTDNRAYRSDHALAEDVTAGNPLVFEPRAGLSLAAVNAFDAGRTANGGNPPDMVAAFENTRKNSPPGTLLGDKQKQWWKDVLSGSTATYKVWGNSLPLVRILLDATNVTLFPGDLILSADGWDGYPTERRELMTFLKDGKIRNVVSLSGDHHAHYVGVVYDDFDSSSPTPVMLDFCAAGISSASEFAEVAAAIGVKVTPALEPIVGPVLKLIVYDSTPLGGTDKAVVNLNTLIRYGSGAAMAAYASNDRAMIAAARNAKINAHLRYADSNAYGYGLASFGADGGEITLVTTEQPIVDRAEDGASVVRKAVFQVPLVAEGDEVKLAEPELSGEKPFPLT